MAIGERIKSALDAPIQLMSVELMATASIGIAVGDAATDGAELLRDADAAMYRAKDGGRNCVALFDEAMQQQAQDHLDRASALRGALDSGQIEAGFQPIVDLGPVGSSAPRPSHGGGTSASSSHPIGSSRWPRRSDSSTSSESTS